MPDVPTETTPEYLAAAGLLSFTKQSANEALIRFLNGLTTNHLAAYPQAEVHSWPYQKAEAAAIIAAGPSATLAMAPFLAGVCAHHFGAATNAARLSQVKAKAVVVNSNAENWTAICQFVNGLRAKTQDAIEAATEPTEVNAALNSAYAAAAAFMATAASGG